MDTASCLLLAGEEVIALEEGIPQQATTITGDVGFGKSFFALHMPVRQTFCPKMRFVHENQASFDFAAVQS